MVRVTNTLTGEKEDLQTGEPGKLRYYVCGLTPYDQMHAGHVRSYIAYDIIRRWLEHEGYDVVHVQNITDVEDKLIARAQEQGTDPIGLARMLHAKAEAQLARLRVLPARHWPKVSDHIDHIIAFIGTLIEKGHAYAAEGSVYFDVATFDDYGKLSNIDRERLLEESRKEAAAGKRNPTDFALWKAVRPNEPSWSSPWGEGRPGWHIECSVMATQILGPTIDIHGGGRDLQFPHHENEIAQSEAATGETFVRHWLHAGFLTVNGEKMSKSTGNFITVADVLEKHRPEAIRLFLASTHYRSPIDFSWKGLAQAEKTLDGLIVPLRRAREAEPRTGDRAEPDTAMLATLDAADQEFRAAMNDDFDTPRALARVHEAIGSLNAYLDQTTPHEEVVTALEAFYTLLDDVFAFVPPVQGAEGLEGELLDLLLEVRELARERKAYEVADAVRDRMTALGLVVEDTADGPRWRRS